MSVIKLQVMYGVLQIPNPSILLALKPCVSINYPHLLCS